MVIMISVILSVTYKNMVSVEGMIQKPVTHDYSFSLIVSNLFESIDILIF